MDAAVLLAQPSFADSAGMVLAGHPPGPVKSSRLAESAQSATLEKRGGPDEHSADLS